MKPIESKRVALDRKIVLRFPDFDGFVTDFAANLSMTGMFVRSQEPQKPGTPVSFELRLEDGAPLVRGSGWVVWARERQESPDRPAGMGIEFTELDHKSRRLVRWMILSQVPEGETPYDVRAAAGAAPATSRTRGRAGSRRVGWAAALAVLLLAGLAVLVWWPELPDRPRSLDTPAAEALVVETEPDPSERRIDPASNRAPGDDVVSAGLEQGPEELAAITGSGASGASAGREAGAAGPQSAAGAITAAVETAIRDWAGAWSDQDVDRYLAHYASDFVPAGGLSRSQWSEERRRRVAGPATIRVAVTRLETRRSPDGAARVSFLQTYQSDGYADTVDKVLELVLESGEWKIRRESAD